MSCSVGAENLYRDPPSIAIVTLLPFSPTTPFLERKKRDNEMKETILGERRAGAMQVRKKVPIVERGREVEGGEFLFPEG